MKQAKALQEMNRRRRRTTVLYFFAISSISLMLVFYIYQYMQMMEIQLAISKVQKDNAALKEQIELRMADRASLGRLERVEEIATRKLGMGLPAKEQMWYIPVGAAPAPAPAPAER